MPWNSRARRHGRIESVAFNPELPSEWWPVTANIGNIRLGEPDGAPGAAGAGAE
jgi:hypothetical protein